MKIEANQTLDIKKLISFKKVSTASALQSHIEALLAYIDACGAKKIGGMISATYAHEGDALSVEIYMPIDKEIPSTDEFIYKPQLILVNCIRGKHKGNPQMIETTMKKLSDYIVCNALTPISVGFSVTITEITSMAELDFFETDVYISINPNIF